MMNMPLQWIYICVWEKTKFCRFLIYMCFVLLIFVVLNKRCKCRWLFWISIFAIFSDKWAIFSHSSYIAYIVHKNEIYKIIQKPSMVLVGWENKYGNILSATKIILFPTKLCFYVWYRKKNQILLIYYKIYKFSNKLSFMV